MKRFLPLLLALVLTIAMTSPALAAGPKLAPSAGNAKSPFTLVGTITAIDATAKTVTVKILRGNSLVKSYIGQEVLIKTSAATLYRFTNGTTTTVITFSDLKIGNAVSVTGTLSGGTWATTRITVGAKLSCLP